MPSLILVAAGRVTGTAFLQPFADKDLAAMAVILFYAALIVAAALIATAIVMLPLIAVDAALYALLPAGLSHGVPGWFGILLAFAVSVATLKVLTRTMPGMLWLFAVILVVTTGHHLHLAWAALDGTGRAVLAGIVAALVAITLARIAMTAGAGGRRWPMALVLRLLALLR